MVTPADPAAFFREMLGQWEKMANDYGGQALRSEEFARSMQGASAATAQAQAAIHQGMEKVLAAANLPSRSDIDAIAARIALIEASLARIEATLDGTPAPAFDKPRPTRGRKPPKKDK